MNRIIKMLFIASVNVFIFWLGMLYTLFEKENHSLEKIIELALTPVNILITIALFLSPFIFYTFNKNTMKEFLEGNEENEYKNALKYLLFSPSSLNNRIKKALNLTEKKFYIKASFIGLYESNKVKILTKSDNANNFKVNDEIDSLKTLNNEIEEILLKCYIEKVPSLEREVHIKDESYYIYTFSLQTEHNIHPFGISLYITKKALKEDKKNLLQHLNETIAFCISISHKKNDIFKKTILENKENKDFDEELNIYTLNKIQSAINYEVNRIKRHKTKLTLVLMEIDHFKSLCNINEEKESDTILKEFIGFIKSNIRITDVFGKWSDDKFAFVIPDQDFNAGIDMSKRLLELMKIKYFAKVGKLTCSFGVTSYFDQKDNPSSFRIRAEEALEKMKKRGGNGVDAKLLV